MPVYNGQGKGSFKKPGGSLTDLGLIQQDRFGLSAEEAAPVSREQARKDTRVSAAEGPFKFRTAQYDEAAGPSGESGPAQAGGQILNWEKDKVEVAGVRKSGIERASSQDDE